MLSSCICMGALLACHRTFFLLLTFFKNVSTFWSFFPLPCCGYQLVDPLYQLCSLITVSSFTDGVLNRGRWLCLTATTPSYVREEGGASSPAIYQVPLFTMLITVVLLPYAFSPHQVLLQMPLLRLCSQSSLQIRSPKCSRSSPHSTPKPLFSP